MGAGEWEEENQNEQAPVRPSRQQSGKDLKVERQKRASSTREKEETPYTRCLRSGTL